MFEKVRRLAAPLVVAVLALTACGDDGTATTSPSPSSTAAPATDVASSTFPVTVTGSNGDVVIRSEPNRIISLSGTLTEMLYAIDAGDQVIAVDQHSDHPAGTPVTELSGFRPNLEAIVAYEPDLVVLSRDRDGIADALSGLGVAAVVLPSATSIDELYRQMETLGTATGHRAEASAAAGELRAELAKVAASVPERERPVRYFYELSGELHSATSDTFIGEVLALAGLESIADGAGDAVGGFPQLSAEYVLEADPDVIFLAHGDGTGLDPAEVGARPGWPELTAVQSGYVVVLDADLASRWGPRVVDLLRVVVGATADIAR